MGIESEVASWKAPASPTLLPLHHRALDNPFWEQLEPVGNALSLSLDGKAQILKIGERRLEASLVNKLGPR